MRDIQWVQEQPSYILYAKPFRETSLLLEVFCRDYGRVSLVARGARRTVGPRKARTSRSSSRFDGLLQSFVPLLLSWRGRGELFNLTTAEPNGVATLLSGRLLVGGWYLNELLVRTLKHWDAHPQLFKAYQIALQSFSVHFKPSLRQFEKSLLTALGIMPSLDRETKTGLMVKAHAWYTYIPGEGIFQAVMSAPHTPTCFQGAVLLAAHNNDWDDQEYGSGMQRLFRLMVDYALMGQPIRSRELL
jgi:DNA repair protein RecO (recombination protein O)